MFLAWWKWFNVSSGGSDSMFLAWWKWFNVSSGGSDSMFLVMELVQWF